MSQRPFPKADSPSGKEHTSSVSRRASIMSRFAKFLEDNKILDPDQSAKNVLKTSTLQTHPYYPTNAIINGYVPNNLPLSAILGGFSTGCIVLFITSALLIRRIQPGISSSDLATAIWFVLCGCLHLFFEGYFVTHPRTLAGSQHFFAQMWKEYSLSDSRYLLRGSFITSVEALTMVTLGPLSLLAAYLVTASSSYEAVVIIIVSSGHLYSNLLYYTTALYEEFVLNKPFSRPEQYYFWVYFIGMNAFWIVIPIVLLYTRIQTCAMAISALKKSEEIRKADMLTKKSK